MIFRTLYHTITLAVRIRRKLRNIRKKIYNSLLRMVEILRAGLCVRPNITYQNDFVTLIVPYIHGTNTDLVVDGVAVAVVDVAWLLTLFVSVMGN